MSLFETALKIALEAHKGQVDKAGEPYILHPIKVARMMKSEDAQVTALLHDVMEDSAYTADDLRKEGIPEHIVSALLLLTHKKGEDYMEYVRRIKTNELASAVKLGDLQHNSDMSRLPAITDADVKRVRKYQCAMAVLKE